MPRRRRRPALRLAVAVAAASALFPFAAAAQALFPNSPADLLQPSMDGDPTPSQLLPFNSTPPAQDQTLPSAAAATSSGQSGLGATPVDATSAAGAGFDSSNAAISGAVLRATASGAAGDTTSAAETGSAAPVSPEPAPAPGVHPVEAANRPGATLPPPPQSLPVSNPPPQVYPRAAANRPGAVLPIPPPADFQASAETPPPGTPPPNTLPLGTPRRPLPIAAGDPYAPLGLRAGSFLIYPSVELSSGYDSNPQSTPGGKPSAYFVVAPELRLQSDWSRHSLKADISGTYTQYGAHMSPSLNRPYLDGTVDGRIDVRHDTHVLLEGRVLVSTDNPGSPNLAAGLAKLPIYTTTGATLGLTHEFNRLEVTAKGTFDRSVYQQSVLTDGEVSSNADRDFNQYGGTLRLGYEFDPGFTPFVEVDADRRLHDEKFDRNGLQRDSTGASVKAGADIDLFGSLRGEIAAGFLERDYKDPTLPNISGVIADGALIWQATALTTAKLSAASSVSESIVPGTSGAFSRDFSLQVDHAFLSWLVGTLQLGYGRDDYVGLERVDDRYFVSSGLTYKLNRDMQLKGTVRQDWLTSTAAGATYDATSFLLSLRLQH